MSKIGGFRHIDGQGCMVACRGCGKDHPEGPWPTIDLMFAAMAEHSWSKGPDLCFECQGAYGKAEAAGLVSFRKDAWDNVEEISPGIWVEKQPKRRRRTIRRLL
jgi:hypothetical protein